MTAHYDNLETREPAHRQADLLAKVNSQIAAATMRAPYWRETLPSTPLTSLSQLTGIGVTRKSDLPRLQERHAPFAGMATVSVSAMSNIFRSPGPIWDAGGQGDFWKSARALFAAGVRRRDVILNCFSYHFTPAGRMFESGAWAIGAAVVPSGTGQTDMQVQAINQLGVGTYAGTPDFLGIILDKAKELGVELPSLKHALVSGGALFPQMRKAYAEQGIEVVQCYGTADVGIIAYEVATADSSLPEGMIVNEDLVVELLDPVTGQPVEEGAVGEVTVTNINPVYPLFRFATGDLSAILPGQSACGRTNMRLKGWMGRADQITKVRGMFIHPSQVGKVLSGMHEIKAARLVITQENNRDAMVLQCVAPGLSEDRRAEAERLLRSVCKVGGTVLCVDKLPEDGKVIDDQRVYE